MTAIHQPSDDRALAVLGGTPRFERPLPVGQLYFPEWDRYEQAFRELFQRQYYTNQGPLTQELEARLAARLQVRHAICVTNATIGLSMVAQALGIGGRVVVPSFTFIATAQALLWSGLEPVFCDVDPATHHMRLDDLERHLAAGASAILAVNLWGGAYDMPDLEALARRFGVPLFFDSAHGFGAITQGRPLGGFGAAEVFSFHATKVFSAGEGGCITTNDDALAEKLRNIRSSYGVRQAVEVFRTANGRLSEAQAAVGLLNLDALDAYIGRNAGLHQAYREGLAGIPGLSVRVPLNVEHSNWQYLICEIDADTFGLSRDQLHQVLQRENVVARRYFQPGIHRCVPFKDRWPTELPATDRLCTRVLQLPLGARTDHGAVDSIIRIVRQAHQAAPRLQQMWAQQAGGG